MPPGTGFGEGVLSGGTVGGVPGSGGVGAGGVGDPGCSGDVGYVITRTMSKLRTNAVAPPDPGQLMGARRVSRRVR